MYPADYDALKLKGVLDEIHLTDTFTAETQQFLIDFLSEFQVKENPKPSNIQDIIIRVAKTELFTSLHQLWSVLSNNYMLTYTKNFGRVVRKKIYLVCIV